MLTGQLDIDKSIRTEKLSISRWRIDNVFEVLFYYLIALAWPFMAGLKIYSDLKFDIFHWTSLILLVITLALSLVLLYTILNLYRLTRITGLSRGKNLGLIKQIVTDKNWNLVYSNHQMARIDFPKHRSGFDWGQEIIILFDDRDILVNCMSFGLHNSPSPFHWYSNRLKVKAFKKAFDEKKNVLQQHL